MMAILEITFKVRKLKSGSGITCALDWYTKDRNLMLLGGDFLFEQDHLTVPPEGDAWISTHKPNYIFENDMAIAGYRQFNCLC